MRDQHVVDHQDIVRRVAGGHGAPGQPVRIKSDDEDTARSGGVRRLDDTGRATSESMGDTQAA
jgi:hypothetical protein